MTADFGLFRVLFGSIRRKFMTLFLIIVTITILANIASFILLVVILNDEHSLKYLLVGIVLSIGSVTIIGLFFFYLERKILQPINVLERQAHALESMDYSHRLKLETGDEFEHINETLNNTMDLLQFVKDEHDQIDKTKTQFFTITSHELRSPMTPMKAQLEMLKQGYFGRLNKKQLESVEIVLRNTTRLDKIIMDLLEVSRIESSRLRFEFKQVNLESSIRRLVKEMKGFHPEKHIRLIARVSKLPTFEVDQDRVMQVLRNLVNNAIKFSPDKGVVEISAKHEDDHILFSVKDSGPGIPGGEQERIFHPFFQTELGLNRKHEGTGLGLTICKGIVEAQKGRIWLESSEGHGAKFYFTVPLKPNKSSENLLNAFGSVQHRKEIGNDLKK